MNHTPTPWHVETDEQSLCAIIYGKGRKRGQRKQHVAQVWSGDDCSLDVAVANAQLICDAVNKCAS